MCHELEGLFHRSPSGITSDLAISLPRPSPSFLAIILEVVNANVVIFPFSGGVWSMSSWRAVSQQHLLGALFPNAAQNRIIEAVSVPCLVRKKTPFSNARTIRFTIPPRGAWSPLRAATVESYCTPRQSGSVLIRHRDETTRRKRRIPSPTSAIMIVFPCPSFISLGVVRIVCYPLCLPLQVLYN